MSEPMQFVRTASPEDQARADCYGMIAQLFYAPPGAQLLSELLRAEVLDPAQARTEQGAALANAWSELREACVSAFPVLLENEHAELFSTPGKAEVTPYLSHYVMRSEAETPLVPLREQLARWGLARIGSASEPEDHIAGVCEAMRYAIAVQHRALEEQKSFFERFLLTNALAFCDAVSRSGKARFYRLVANFARAFLEVEREAFAMI